MKTKQAAIDFCLSLADTYEDYPFHDYNWAIMRHKSNKKMFAAIYEYQGELRINVKSDPNFAYIWRNMYESVIPAYHMNKVHWNTIILNGSVPENEIKNMIDDSYNLTLQKKKGKKNA